MKATFAFRNRLITVTCARVDELDQKLTDEIDQVLNDDLDQAGYDAEWEKLELGSLEYLMGIGAHLTLQG